jgi:hypothetical protein
MAVTPSRLQEKKGPMGHSRRVLVAVTPCLILLAATLSASGQNTRLPVQLGNDEFWELVSNLSEPDGFFEDENYVSNELGYQTVMTRLQRDVTPGGVFVGVGPEQNFAYIAATRPAIAFVVDIRRQNLVQHLMYKALFALSADRADFVSRLFSRPRPPALAGNAAVAELFESYSAVRVDGRLFDRTLTGIFDVLGARGFALDDADRAAMRKVLAAFRDEGPDIHYVFRGTAELHPTYVQMMTATDAAGRSWSYLASVDTFEYIRLMEARNLIVPVVGNFAGPKALREIGGWLRARDARVSLFYASNVEPYLFAAGTWKAFYENLNAMPLAEDGAFVRAFFGSTSRECGKLRPTIRTPVVGQIGALMDAFRSDSITSQCDLVRLGQ